MSAPSCTTTTSNPEWEEFEVEYEDSGVNKQLLESASISTILVPAGSKSHNLHAKAQDEGEGSGLSFTFHYNLVSKTTNPLHTGCSCGGGQAARHCALNQLLLSVQYERRLRQFVDDSTGASTEEHCTVLTIVFNAKNSQLFLDGFSGTESGHQGGALFRHDWAIIVRPKPTAGQTVSLSNIKPRADEVRDSTDSTETHGSVNFSESPLEVGVSSSSSVTTSQLKKLYAVDPIQQEAQWINALRLKGGAVLSSSDLKKNWWSFKTVDLDSPFIREARPFPQSVDIEFRQLKTVQDGFEIEVEIIHNYWNVAHKYLNVFERRSLPWQRIFRVHVPFAKDIANDVYKKTKVKAQDISPQSDPAFP